MHISSAVIAAFLWLITMNSVIALRTVLGRAVGARGNAFRFQNSAMTTQPVPEFLTNCNDRRVSTTHKMATMWLSHHGVPDAEDSSRHLLSDAAALGTRRSDFTRSLDRQLTPAEMEKFSLHCHQRAQRIPVQYIIGNWDFYGLTLLCRPPVLIPRPETEELVEKIVTELSTHPKSALSILDVGAGTGAIGIALAAHLPHAVVTAIDINPIAVKLANDNANLLTVSARYTCLEMDFQAFAKAGRKFDLVVSNPPYIPSAELPGLQEEVRLFEDRLALDGGVDGMDMVMQLIEHGDALLSADGSRALWLEVDPSHPAALEALESKAKHNIERVDSFKDMSGNPRFVRVQYCKHGLT